MPGCLCVGVCTQMEAEGQFYESSLITLPPYSYSLNQTPGSPRASRISSVDYMRIPFKAEIIPTVSIRHLLVFWGSEL